MAVTAAGREMGAEPRPRAPSLRSQPSTVQALLLATGVGGLAVLAFTTLAFRVSPAIALPFTVGGIDPVVLGVAFWTAICLVTSSIGLAPKGRAALVLAIGPLIASAALGGPTAAAWVALLGTFEARELRGQVPWYGVLFNHLMTVIAFTTGGFAIAALRAVSGTESGALVDFMTMMAGAAVAVAVAGVLTMTAVSARTGHSPRALLPMRADYLVGLLAAEASLAWLIAWVYPSGWWAGLLFILIDSTAAGSLARHRADWDLRHDQLTELPNGRSLDDRIIELRRAPEPGLCVLYVDLDGFKAINDTHDHFVGDDVLRVTGQRLAAACRDNDLLVRLHGDEFVVLATGLLDEHEADALAQRLVAAIEDPIPHAVGDLRVSATVGIQMVGDIEEIRVAIRQADGMMAAAKIAKAAQAGRIRLRR